MSTQSERNDAQSKMDAEAQISTHCQQKAVEDNWNRTKEKKKEEDNTETQKTSTQLPRKQ